MATLIVYPETVQFRQVVSDVTQRKGHAKQLIVPILKFTGTVKLHGSNAAIAYQQNTNHWCQSRNHVITPDKDNADFARHMSPLASDFFTEYVLPHCPVIQKYNDQGSTIIIYGEWCGGNIQGQANVAIAGLTKMFVIFKIKIINQPQVTNTYRAQKTSEEDSDGFWLDPKEWANVKWHEHFIYNIYDFPTYEIDIDFNAPELSQDMLTQITETIEEQCPVGAYFARAGCGEGVVWTEWTETHGCLTFKIKGKKHSVVNTKTLVPIRTVKITNVHDFVEYACTENRMQQAYHYLYEELKSAERKDFNIFVRWLVEDMIKEENDTMAAAHIDAKDINSAITSKAQVWFNDRLVEDHKTEARQERTKIKISVDGELC